MATNPTMAGMIHVTQAMNGKRLFIECTEFNTKINANVPNPVVITGAQS